MAKVYEMLWDCPYCDTKKLLGKTHRFCPTCGAPQDPTLRYFPGDADKVAVEDHIFTGADRVCGACRTPNSANSVHCVQCGADLNTAKVAGLRQDIVTGEGQGFQGETVAAARAELQREREARHAAVDAQAKPAGRSIWFKLGVGLAALVVLVAVALFWEKPSRVEVIGHTWERNIEVEVFGPVRDSAWCDGMPGDAYQVSRSREVRSHRNIPDGQECSTRRTDRGDGTYSESQECRTKYRSEPVYDTRCTYTVDRWHTGRTERSSGRSLTPEPSWPPLTLKAGTCKGCEREGARHSSYVVQLVDGEASENFDCDLPEAQWKGMGVGSTWIVEVGVLTGHADCDTLKAPK